MTKRTSDRETKIDKAYDKSQLKLGELLGSFGNAAPPKPKKKAKRAKRR